MLLYLVLGAVFSSVFLLVLFSGIPVVLKRNPRSTISQLPYYSAATQKRESVAPSLFERMIIPFFTRIASLVKRISPVGVVESTKHRLELTGSLEAVGVDVYLAVKFLFPVGFLFLLILLSIFLTMPLILKIILIVLIPLSYFFPDIYLRRRIVRRQKEIRKSLPDALDMLTISVEAGMGFDIALAKVAKNIKGALGEEFNRMLQEMQIGFSRKDAFRNLGKRTDVPDLSSFIVAMIQADIFGISIGKVLRVQASEMRTRRRQQAEEKGIKAPVKLVFPLILCLFPSLMTVILGPAAIRIYYTIMEIFGR